VGQGFESSLRHQKTLDKSDTYAPLDSGTMVSLWPLLYPHNAWLGTANPRCGTIKISKGKHIRDASVLERGFAVAAFVPTQCVGRDCESSLLTFHEVVPANGGWQPMKLILVSHIQGAVARPAVDKCGRRFGVKFKRIDAPLLDRAIVRSGGTRAGVAVCLDRMGMGSSKQLRIQAGCGAQYVLSIA
jgi:hypothetical protein